MLCINTNLDFLLCSNFLFTKMEKGGSGGGLVGDNDICGGGRSLVVSNNGRVVEEEDKINTQSKIMI